MQSAIDMANFYMMKTTVIYAIGPWELWADNYWWDFFLLSCLIQSFVIFDQLCLGWYM